VLRVLLPLDDVGSSVSEDKGGLRSSAHAANELLRANAPDAQSSVPRLTPDRRFFKVHESLIGVPFRVSSVPFWTSLPCSLETEF